jgi:hypothetical protein
VTLAEALTRALGCHPGTRENDGTPQTMTPVDLEELGAQITATVERAKADDPRTLRARIRDLEEELEVQKTRPAPEPVVERVEVNVVDEATVTAIRADIVEPLLARVTELTEALATVTTELPQEGNQGSHGTPSSARRPSSSSRPVRGAGAGSSTPREKPSPGHQRETRPATDPGEALVPPAKRKLLEALVALESIGVDAAPRNQVALFAGVSPASSGYSNNLGALRSLGLLDYPGPRLVVAADVLFLGGAA